MHRAPLTLTISVVAELNQLTQVLSMQSGYFAFSFCGIRKYQYVILRNIECQQVISLLKCDTSQSVEQNWHRAIRE